MDLSTVIVASAAKIGFILVIILTFAPLIIWAERRQSALMQDRIGPVRAGIKLPKFVVDLHDIAFKGLAGLAIAGIVSVVLVFGFNAVSHLFAAPGEAFALPEAFWPLVGATVGAVVLAVPPYLMVKHEGNVTLIGLLHPLADAVKFIWQEDFIPPKGDKLLHSLAPIVSLVPAIAAFAILPFGPELYWEHVGEALVPGAVREAGIPLQVAPLNVGILFAFAVAGTGVIGAAIGGYASDNKFALLGGLRAAGQMVSYEVALGLTIVPAFMMYGTLRLDEMVLYQHEHAWGIFYPWLTAAFVLFFTASIAETKRIPFDVPEGESELVAGYFTEYSGMKFGMFFMAEFVEVVVLAAFATTFFFGGWDLPFLYEYGLDFQSIGITSFGGIENAYIPMPHWLVVLLQVLGFLVKVTLLIMVQLQIRWTLPRFRYDQIMALCWKYMLPLALVNILITGAIILVFNL